MPFQLQDWCLLNELTLCIFDSGYWWSISLRVPWHKEAFCSRFSVSSPCVLLVVLCFLIPHVFPKGRSTLKGRLFNSPPFYSFATEFLYFHNISLLSQSPVSILSPASMPQPCLSCSRFSFCWLVLIGLKWVTSSITESFKPSLNVSISWGSGGIVVLSFPPLAALRIGGETPGLMGVAKVWPPGKSAGLCQHSLQCTQRPQDQ